jgi:DNA-binding PadR family transcriptional regulator
MRGDILLSALELIGKTGYAADKLLHALDKVVPPYDISMSEALSGTRRKRTLPDAPPWKERQRLYRLLSKLKAEELIKPISEGAVIRLTYRGTQKWKQLLKRQSQYRDYKNYPVVKDGITRIISFDIPEHNRNRRAWLRGVLTHLEFTMRKQSCWIGTTKLPKEFMDDLVSLRLLPFVDILAVTKHGTLREIS